MAAGRPTRCRVIDRLAEQGPLTPSELADATDRSPRSVRYVLRELRKEGRVSYRRDVQDPRQRLYSLERDESSDRALHCGEDGAR